METLETRKAKFKEFVDKGEDYEDDDNIPKAIKSYREALKYSLHKKDTDDLNTRIQRLKNTHEFVSGVPESGGSKKGLIIGIVIGILALGGAIAAFIIMSS